MRRKRILISLIGMVLIIGMGIWALAVIVGGRVPTDNPRVANTAQTDERATKTLYVRFPILRGTNLLLTQKEVPTELTGLYKLIVVAYTPEQQETVESWLPALEELIQDFPELAGYYVPLLPKDTADSALFIIGGMSLYAQNDRDRERTIVVFTDIDVFNAIFEINSIADIRLFLLNPQAEVVWQTAGGYSAEGLADLRQALIPLTENDLPAN